MKTVYILPVLCLLFSCKKKDAAPPPPVTIAQSALNIPALTQADINEVNVSCQVSPAAGEVYASAWLHWSSSADFVQDRDSMLLADTIRSLVDKVVPVKGLKQATKYYLRLSVTYKNTRFFSTAKEWTTDTLRIIKVSDNPNHYVNRGVLMAMLTNLAHLGYGTATDARIFLGNYECEVQDDRGSAITFIVPPSVPHGKYRVELRRKGLTSYYSDSVEVMRGWWTELTPPPFPLHPSAAATGLIFFGTTQSSAKGWIVGGSFFNPAPGEKEGSVNGSLYEFDPQQRQWTRRLPVNRRYFENTVCHYYNNSIYVIGGIETIFSGDGTYWESRQTLKRMKRLDLGTLTWHDMDSVPYRNFTGMPSFAYNDEFYIGMGSNGDSLSQCCGDPLPSKKFWKYSPASNQWTRLADFPGGHQSNPTFFTLGNKAYAWYGAIPIGYTHTATTFLQELWEYDIPANAWKRVNLPAGHGLLPGEKCSVVTYNGKAYFLTAQKLTLFGTGYGFWPQSIFLEWDPATNTFRKTAYPLNAGILRPVYQSGDRFYFQSDALGYFEKIPNITYSFTME